MPLIRCLTDRIGDSCSKKTVVTFRGSWLSLQQYNAIGIGLWYRVPIFIASSKSLATARDFASKHNPVFIRLKIPPECYNAGNLNGENEDEQEYLLPPYTAVYVREKFHDSDGRWIVVDVAQDNKNTLMSLPSILL